MDVNEHRDILITHNRLQNTDDVYTFYYDETNNIRKLYLTDLGLNVEQDDNFVLAGILHKGIQNDADFSALFDTLNLQKTVKELKFKHIAKGPFLDILKSKKLCTVLCWLSKNGFYIHYFNLNLLYWSVVDMVDSIIGELNNPFYIMNHMQIKSDFYELANSNRSVFLRNLKDFNYPNVRGDRCDDFCLWLIAFVNNQGVILPDLNKNILNGLVKESLSIDELPFISGFREGELISEFMVFYLRNLYLYKNSKHVFDEEHQIEDNLKDFPLTENSVPLNNYEFVRSHDYKAIQISDVVAGLFGKYFTYLKNVSDEQLIMDKAELTSQQLETLGALKKIIDVSDELSRGFFNVVSSSGEQRKNNSFLHGV
ncbi:MAG: DUF3800 domain-containing protein [Paraglaciecola sp.]|uniref:DUF3800 domain-containing protein n=1 Tax=Paraglaciecola sp. TaxID=1920173 RepID=UPI003296DA36